MDAGTSRCSLWRAEDLNHTVLHLVQLLGYCPEGQFADAELIPTMVGSNQGNEASPIDLDQSQRPEVMYRAVLISLTAKTVSSAAVKARAP